MAKADKIQVPADARRYRSHLGATIVVGWIMLCIGIFLGVIISLGLDMYRGYIDWRAIGFGIIVALGGGLFLVVALGAFFHWLMPLRVFDDGLRGYDSMWLPVVIPWDELHYGFTLRLGPCRYVRLRRRGKFRSIFAVLPIENAHDAAFREELWTYAPAIAARLWPDAEAENYHP